MIEVVDFRTATEADARVASRLLMLALHDLDAQAGRPPRDQLALASEPALRHLIRTDPQRFWIAEATTPAAEAAAVSGHTGPVAVRDTEPVAAAAVHCTGSAAGVHVGQPAGGEGGATAGAQLELEPIGFGAAMVRGNAETPGALWFVAGLFIRPDWQRRGVGRALLERTLAGYPAPGGVLAVVTSAANAQSNTLYAQYGLYPLLPLLCLSRQLPAPDAGVDTAAADSANASSAGAVGAAPSGPSGTRERSRPVEPAGRRYGDLDTAPITPADVDRLRAIDLEVLGVDRTVDHEWLLDEMKRAGWLFLRAGAPVGYGYLGGDGSQIPDQVGPIAALDPGDQPAMAGFLLDRAAESGWNSATFVVPGANLELQRCLWARGFVMSGTSELFGASRPFGRFDRYAFVGDALM